MRFGGIKYETGGGERGGQSIEPVERENRDEGTEGRTRGTGDGRETSGDRQGGGVPWAYCAGVVTLETPRVNK